VQELCKQGHKRGREETLNLGILKTGTAKNESIFAVERCVGGVGRQTTYAHLRIDGTEAQGTFNCRYSANVYQQP
jgi:hypothetical protein